MDYKKEDKRFPAFFWKKESFLIGRPGLSGFGNYKALLTLSTAKAGRSKKTFHFLLEKRKWSKENQYQRPLAAGKNS